MAVQSPLQCTISMAARLMLASKEFFSNLTKEALSVSHRRNGRKKHVGRARHARLLDRGTRKLVKLQFFKMPIVALAFGVAIGLSFLASGDPY